MKYKRLSNQVIINVILIFVLLLIMFSISIFYNSKQTVEKTIGERTITIATNMMNFINPEEYKELVENPNDTKLYEKLRKELNDLREKSGVLYAYTYFPLDDTSSEVRFIVDGMPLEDTENAAALGDASTTTNIDNLKESEKDGRTYTGLIEGKYGSYITGIIPMKDASGNTIAFIGVDIDASNVENITTSVLKAELPIVFSYIIVVVVILLFILARFVRKQLAPLQLITEVSQKLSSGDISEAKQLMNHIQVKTKNEIAFLNNSFVKTVDYLENSFTKLNEKALEVDKEVINIVEVTDQTNDSVITLLNNVEHLLESNKKQKVNNEEVLTAMTEMSIGTQTLADTTAQMAESSNEMEQFVEEATKEALVVVEQIKQVEVSIKNSTNEVKLMGNQFKTVESIVQLITSIADQTNLLALNASIEAARAGEHGKGFAVVAEEVRKLAELSAKSASEINEQINIFVKQTNSLVQDMDKNENLIAKGTAAVTHIGTQLVQIKEIVTSINSTIQDNSAVIEEMSAGAEEILASVNEINGLVDKTLMATMEVETAAQVQKNISVQLNEVVSSLEQTTIDINNELKKFN